MVEVTQADRVAAAAIYEGLSGYYGFMQVSGLISAIRGGLADDNLVVQHVARHRTEATAALEERVKLLEAALEPFAKRADARRRSGLQGAVCFPQRFLIAAREALNDPR